MTALVQPETIQQELMTLAKRVAQAHADLPNLDAILLTGSVVKGRTDAVSDIDLMFYYSELPTIQAFEAMKEAAVKSGGGIYSYAPEEGLACYHFVDGVKVDFAHQRTSEIAEMVDTFLGTSTVDSGTVNTGTNTATAGTAKLDDETTHIIMSGISQGVLLYGGEVVRTWQKRLTMLPSAYTEKLVRQNLRFPPKAVMLEMGVARQDYALVYELLLASIPRMVNIWSGLNGKIPPGKIKASDQFVATLALVPDNVGERLRRMWIGPPEQSAAIFYQLVDETLSLVRQHRPEIDISAVQERLDLKLQKRVEASSAHEFIVAYENST